MEVYFGILLNNDFDSLKLQIHQQKNDFSQNVHFDRSLSVGMNHQISLPKRGSILGQAAWDRRQNYRLWSGQNWWYWQRDKTAYFEKANL